MKIHVNYTYINTRGLFLINLLLLILISEKSNAIPAFSRKYGTSCVTCHAIYPKLNPFGEAFKLNGYKYPIDDDDKVKEEPQQLGSKAYKRVWPKSVWPNSVPKTVAFSLRARDSYEMTTVNKASTTEFTRPALQLLASGAIGENLSAFVGAHLFENGVSGSIDRLFLRFNNILSQHIPEHLLNIQVGQFIPHLVPFATNHRGLTNSAYAFNTYDPSMERNFVATHVHGAGPFGIEAFQLGIEASGIVKSRLHYVLGVVNGSGTEVDINSDKDLYGRLSYKIGGMGFDGSIKDSASTENETSVALGVFGYKGISTDNNVNFNFYRMGGDINFYFKKLNIIGGYILGENGTADNQKYNLFFGEIDYQLYPWLTGILRYEQANPNTLKSFSQIVPHFSVLVVANMKFKIETRINPENITFNNLYVGFDFAF